MSSQHFLNSGVSVDFVVITVTEWCIHFSIINYLSGPEYDNPNCELDFRHISP